MLIGLTGPSRSGKDSVARILVNDFGYQQRVLAASIREILLGLDPLLKTDDGAVGSLKSLFARCEENWDLVKAESRESVDLMIKLGQTCRDVIGDDVWLNAVLPSVSNTKNIVISDVRQPNEHVAIKERGGKIWRVCRPGAEVRAMDGLLENYDIDARIDNRGSLVDLRGIVQATIAADLIDHKLNISSRVTS